MVLPLIREFIVAKDDVPMDVYQLMEEFTKENCGIEFDFSSITQMEIP